MHYRSKHLEMASFLSLSFIFLTSLLFMFISSSQSYDLHYSEKVNVSIYYETLCPASADFINKLKDVLFNKALIIIVNLRLVPWGNAQILKPNQTFYCQHGPDECYFNTIQACAIKSYSYSVAYTFFFIRCVENEIFERLPVGDKEKVWHYCAECYRLDTKIVEDCYKSGGGRKLELEYANETESLNPPRTYVPWVAVNNQHIRFEDLSNLTTYICNAYKGYPVPKGCRSIPPRSISTKKKQFKPPSFAMQGQSCLESVGPPQGKGKETMN